MIDGVTFPDRSPKPGLWELKQIASPVRVVSGADAARRGVVVLENRGWFRDASWLRAAWSVTSDGASEASGELALPAIPPGGRAEVALPGFALPAGGEGDRHLTLRFLLAQPTPWAPAGFELGWAQVELVAGELAAGREGWSGTSTSTTTATCVTRHSPRRRP